MLHPMRGLPVQMSYSRVRYYPYHPTYRPYHPRYHPREAAGLDFIHPTIVYETFGGCQRGAQVRSRQGLGQVRVGPGLPACIQPGTFELQPSNWNLLIGTFELEPSNWNPRIGTFELQPSNWNLRIGTYLRIGTFESEPSNWNPRIGTYL